MIHCLRALVALSHSLAALALCAWTVAGHSPAHAQEHANGNLAEAVKVFDFDERPLGNFEDTPMYWRQLTGDGLPPFSAGRLDEEVGHSAPPSFQFTLRGGNIGYEYEHDDLPVTPDCDYSIEGWVRAENLVHARAFLSLYLVDAAGEHISGTEQVSPLAGPCPSASHDWQRLQIPLYVAASEAAAMRLQLWVLQSYVFAEADPNTPDPIILQDVDARVWFDDLAVLRLPRVVLSLTNIGGLVKPGSAEALELDIQNTLAEPLTAEVTIRQENEASVEPRLLSSVAVSAGAHELFRIALPDLEPGVYRALAIVSTRDEQRPLSDRAIGFAVLPESPAPFQRRPDFGVDLGPWPLSDAAGAVELITSLGCGAIKVGLPIANLTADGPTAERIRQARDLVQQMAAHGIETTAVILPPAGSAGAVPLARVLASDADATEAVGPMIAHLAGQLSCVQLGADSVELLQPSAWDVTALAELRQQLNRHATIPTLVVPRSLLDAQPGPGTGHSYWVPPELPTCSLPWHLAGLSDTDADLVLSLGMSRPDPVDDQTSDLARRVILAKAADPIRLYVPAPFELSSRGGRPAWRPTRAYLALRALFQELGHARPVAVLNCGDDATALLFQRHEDYLLAAWTWRPPPASSTIDLYTRPGSRASITLSQAPRMIADVDGPLLQLQGSFTVTPALLELHNLRPLMLTLTNPYDAVLAGIIEIAVPSSWAVSPNPVHLQLASGETLHQPLIFEIPPRQLAADQALHARICIQRPEPAELELLIPLQVGLQDITLQATAWWDGADLLVWQCLRNSSHDTVSFDASCQAPNRPLLETAFLHVVPGDARDHTFRLPAARDLAGDQLWISVREIGGRRSLDQVINIPP